MESVILALLSATGYGAADFLAGLAARRASVTQVTLLIYITGTVAMAAILPWGQAGRPSASALGWGAVAGAGLAAEALLLAAGFRRAEFSIASPLSAVVGAGLAAGTGLALGERPGAFALAGLLLALPAIMAVSEPQPLHAGRWLPRPTASRRGTRELPGHRLGGVGFGVTAGIGGAVFLIGLARASAAAGAWPVLTVQASAAAATALVAGATGNLRLPSAGTWRLCVASGVIGTASALFYLAAVHAGILAIAAVVTALFPVVTVALAMLVEKERLGRIRLAGLVLATTAVALIGISATAG